MVLSTLLIGKFAHREQLHQALDRRRFLPDLQR